MQLDFFPSRTLTFYLARLFVSRLLAVLIMLVFAHEKFARSFVSGDLFRVFSPEFLKPQASRAMRSQSFGFT